MFGSNHLLNFLPVFTFVCSSFDEYRLLQYLKENYDHFERPVENTSSALDVKVRFLLNQILDVDEKNQVMSILAYIDYHWNDYKLRWDPKMFGGIRDVRFAGEQDAPFKLWKPDVLLFNSVSESFDATYSSRFIVNYDGEVQQNPPGIFRFICKVDVTYYPFDTQVCFLKLGSWTYSGSKINLDFMLNKIIGVKGHEVLAASQPYGDNPDSYSLNESIDLQVYLQNGEWDLMNTPGTRVVTVFGDESYHELYYYIHIRRRTLAYGINLIIPSLVISMMTVLGFTLPPDACEKITLETTVLLSVIFFLQMVSNMSPPQSKSVPILAAFFSCCLMVVACSCVFTVLVICLHQRKAETHEMSPMSTQIRYFPMSYFRQMRRVFVEWLPYILMMRTPDHPRAPKPRVINKGVLPVHRLSILPVLNLTPRCSATEETRKSSLKLIEKRPEYLRYFVQFCDELELITSDLNKMTLTIKDMYDHEMIVSEWRFAAMAVDRLCLFLFSVFITISTCGIIMPHIITGLKDQLEHDE